MTEREALKLALEALEMFCEHGAILRPIETRDAIKEALAQPEQELTTTLEASIHAGFDKKNNKNPQVDHQGKQPEQEPVACYEGGEDIIRYKAAEAQGYKEAYFALLEKLAKNEAMLPRQTILTMPQRTWIGLDADEVFELASGRWTLGQMAVLVEAKLKQKNGYAEEKNNG